LNYVSELGYDAVLVGTSLMKTGKPGMALERLLGGVA
jgi:indole-3-glycerol phosphate synthase